MKKDLLKKGLEIVAISFLALQSAMALADVTLPTPLVLRNLAVVRLPPLAIDHRGYILPHLGPAARQLHQKFYNTKELQLVGGRTETFREYQSNLATHYNPGQFQQQRISITKELGDAINTPVTTPTTIEPNFDLAQDRIILKFKELDPRIIKAIKSKSGLVDIFIPQGLYDDSTKIDVRISTANRNQVIENGVTVKQMVDRYISDLEANGHWVQLYKISGGDHKNIKSTLVNDRRWGLVGSVMIGSLPTAWFHNTNDFHGATTDFPTDLYFMDLDGTWTDSNGDGLFESHSGDVAPEIWAGRIVGNLPATGKSEAQIIAEYFSRNHWFRTQSNEKFPQQLFSYTTASGKLLPHYRSFAFHDDDWSNQAASQYLQNLANERILVNGNNNTNASEYLNRIKAIPGGFWYLHIMAHSSPTSHSFKTGGSWDSDGVSLAELEGVDRRAHFYNLFNCSGARFTTNDFFGGIYTFGNDYGLGAVGSTKTGSMLGFDVYYANLAGYLKPEHASLATDWDVVVGQKATFGTAFLKWFRYIAKGGFTQDERNWHYGMVHLGDPTLYADWTLNKGSKFIFIPIRPIRPITPVIPITPIRPIIGR
ncbi:MAG: hypothetical protein HQK51_10970 [Oligoflexia bacterium]|nr:hypothetical protein [Oligoflexia bacterium]